MNATINNAEHDLFDETLVSEDEFPASIRLARSPRECSEAARRAEITLRAMSAIEDSRDEVEHHSPAELLNARIEAKLDLTLGLLGMLCAQNEMIPPVQAVRWSRRGLRVKRHNSLPIGSMAICSAYLLPTLPLPVDLPVEVVASEVTDDGFLLWFKLSDATPGVQDGIERELFRRHRRTIAERRAAR
jgi:Atypical PilZ domain, cyclic di-GMP receptor